MAFVRGYWVLVLGLIILALGVVQLVTLFSSVYVFGWSAYAPLTSTTFAPGFAPMLPLFEIAVGIALIAGWVGYRIGCRRANRSAG
jgi:heme/copper-type cytochrome/quinol oxidase subunit 1